MTTPLPPFTLDDRADGGAFPNRPATRCSASSRRTARPARLSMPLIEAAHRGVRRRRRRVGDRRRTPRRTRALVEQHGLDGADARRLGAARLVRLRPRHRADDHPRRRRGRRAAAVRRLRQAPTGRSCSRSWRDRPAARRRPWSIGRSTRRSRPGCGSKSVEPGIAERLAAEAEGSPLRARRIEIARGRRPVRVHVRPGAHRRPAGRAADAGARAAHARRHAARPAGGRRGRAAEHGAGDGREGRDQRRDGRLQARVPAGRDRRHRGGVHRRVQHARRHGDDVVRHAGAHRQRPDPRPHRHEHGAERARPGQPRQRDDRPRAASSCSATSAARGPAAPSARRSAGPDKYTSASPNGRSAALGAAPRRARLSRRRTASSRSSPTAGRTGSSTRLSRTAHALGGSYGLALEAVCHPKSHGQGEVLLVVSPEHVDTFARDGWTKADLRARIQEVTRARCASCWPTTRAARAYQRAWYGAAGPDRGAAQHARPQVPRAGVHPHRRRGQRGRQVFDRVRRLGHRPGQGSNPVSRKNRGMIAARSGVETPV